MREREGHWREHGVLGLKRADEKERRKREKRREIMREEREISGLKRRRESIKNYYFVLELCYSAILPFQG